MKKIDLKELETWSKGGHRTSLGAAMIHMSEEYKNTYTVVADITNTARMEGYEERFPDRFFNVGIAEQNTVGFVSGLAKEGLTAFAVTIAAFTPMRCAEQIRSTIAYMNMNAKFVGIEAGVRFGTLGNTHFSMDDMNVMRAMPNFTVIAPSDPHQIYKALVEAAKIIGPVYIRLTGEPGFPVLYPNEFDFTIGKAIERRSGSDICLISCGSILAEVEEAADILATKGLSTRVIDMHTIKPLDKEILNDIFNNNKAIITVEEHSIIGGLGTAVSEYKAEVNSCIPLKRLGLPDKFRPIGNYRFQLESAGITAKSIAEEAEKISKYTG